MNDSNIEIDWIKNLLAEKNLRVTQQRIVILRELISRKDHPTAEDIHSRLKSEYPTLSLATVYKALDTFYKNDLIKKIKSTDESAHYDADLSFHHHLFCTRTHRIIDFEDKKLEMLISDYFRKKKIENFNIKEVCLEIFGETIN